MPHTIDTPALDRLNEVIEDRDTLLAFLHWLQSHKMLIHEYTTGITGIRDCPYEDDSLNLSRARCPGASCDKCSGKGYVEILLDDRYLPLRTSHEQLVEQYLELDPQAMEAERRLLLERLADG